MSADTTVPVLVVGRVFTSDPDRPWADAVLTDGDRIAFVGDAAEARRLAPADAIVIEAAGVVAPGFVDGHAHLLMAGNSLLQAQLRACTSIDDIAAELIAWRERHPEATRVLGLGWLFTAVPDAVPTRRLLDAIVPDVPVYLHAADLHSVWVNTLALDEMGIDDDTPDPVGGSIVRDADGRATGLLLETAAIEHAWPLVNVGSADEEDRWLRAIVDAYLAAGTTTAVDMALDESGLAALDRAMEGDGLPFTVVGHWIVLRTGDSAQELSQVAVAAAHAARHRDGRVRVAGIKLILDGTIDGCTAALLDPYATHVGGGDVGDGVGELIWPREALDPVVLAADEAGLQIAMHAIGDRAVRTALDSLEVAAAARRARGDTGDRRHRIEHLEYVDAADVGRLAELGVTASMQPVHCDPAIIRNWIDVLGGDERTRRGFAWPEYIDSGATLAFGTDTPTANYEPLPNMFIASTRRSPVDATLAAYIPSFALDLVAALGHATRDSAWASFLENERGVLRPGLAADLVVLDRDPFVDDDAILHARVVCTMVDGHIVYRRED